MIQYESSAAVSRHSSAVFTRYDKDGVPSRNAASNAGGYLSGAINDKFQQYCEKNFPGLKKVYSEDGLTISWQYNGKTIYTTTHTSTAAASGNSITLDPETPIDIAGGKVVGTYSEDGRVAIYKGIPYAAAPVGENRWQRPQDVQLWDGVLVADEFGADAWQNRPNMENWWMALYSENMLIEHTVRYNISEELDAEQGGGSGNYAVMDMAKSLQWVHDNIEKFGGDPNNVTVMGQSAGGIAVSSMIASPLAEGLFQHVFIISGGNVVAGTNDRAKVQAELAERNTGNYSLAQLRAMSSEEVVDAHGFTAGSFVIDDYVFVEDSATRIMEGRANKCDVMYNSNYGEASAQDVKTYGDLKAAVTSLMSTGGGWGGTPVVPPTEELLALYYKAYPTAAYTSDDDLLTQADIDTYTVAVHDKAMAGYLSTGNLVKKMGDVNMYVAHFSRALPDAQNGMINGSFHTADVPFWLGAFTHEYAKWQGDVPQVNTYNPNERLYYISGLDLELSNRALTHLINFAKNGDPNGVGTTDLPYWYGFDEDNFGYMSLGDKDLGTSITYRALTPAQTALWSGYHASRLDLSEYSK